MSLYVDMEKKLGKFRLSVKFESGKEVLGILGASGCGKSMTLKCIAGIVRPDRGKVVLDGRVLFDSEKGIDLPPQKRHVGLLFQNYALFPNMTVEKNLMAGLKVSEKNKAKAKAQVADIIDRFYLTGLEKHRPHQLSGGQQQRTALARILLTKPQLLMLDEPFSALDGYLRWKLEMELMDILKEFHGTALFVSHSRDEIYRICQKVCVMDQGNSTPVVTVKDMFEEPKTLAACQLSGCKNYSEAENCHGNEVYARDWGIRLDCGCPIPPGITHIGVRSHYIHLLSPEECLESDKINRMECRIKRIVEDVFNMVVMAEPLKAAPGSGNSQLRLEMPKEQWFSYTKKRKSEEGDLIDIWIEPHDILLLRAEDDA